MSDCLSYTQIVQLRDVAPEAPSPAAKHLETCARCRERLDTIIGDDRLADDIRRAELERGELGSDNLPKIAGYRLIKEIGRGGMGMVFEAVQERLSRSVALKILPTLVHALRPESAERFKSEAETAASLQHPNIVPIFDYGCDGECHFYAMELVQGPSLAEIIKRQKETGGAERRDYRRIAQWIAEVADALQFAHDRGVIHRDIKPPNLILSETTNRMMVSDFGLAKDARAEDVTRTGQVLGTWRYMSPEQVATGAKAVDHRTDLYSLGVTLYELLTLQPAIPGREGHAILRNVVEHEPIAPRRVLAQIPKPLETICRRAMAKSVHERYQSASDLSSDLQHFIDGEPISTRGLHARAILKRIIRKHRYVIALAVAGALILSSVFSATAYFESQRVQAELRTSSAADLAWSAKGHLEAGDYNMAVSVYSRALDLDPLLIHVYPSRAIARSRIGDFDGAIEDLDAFLDAKPQHARSYFRRGVLHLMNGRIESAVADFDRALEHDALLEEALLFRYFNSPDPDDPAGLPDADQSESGSIVVLFALGEKALSNGDREGARWWFERALTSTSRLEFVRLFCEHRLRQIAKRSGPIRAE